MVKLDVPRTQPRRHHIFNKEAKALALLQLRQAHFKRWWQDRRDTGSLLTEIGSFRPEPKVDYIGQLPWPEWVAGKSLWQHYVYSTGCSCTKGEFEVMLRREGVIYAKKQKGVLFKSPDGRPLWYEDRMFLMILETEWKT